MFNLIPYVGPSTVWKMDKPFTLFFQTFAQSLTETCTPITEMLGMHVKCIFTKISAIGYTMKHYQISHFIIFLTADH